MAYDAENLRSALAARYRVERELGRGGMATVYLARDLRHERPVAIKVLQPELAATLGPERFLREIKLTAQLNHPHILPLLDSGEAGGFLYYVMPYVEGESLRDRLKREKQLPIEHALEIAREVADALDYAHRHDLVHRDVKPENILLEEQHAVVADFGIARAIRAAGAEKLTATGMAVGTPEYMSPEQASGSGELDGRTDIYALGCVLYEMLAGEPPFTGPTVESVVHQHLSAKPPEVTGMRRAVPAEVVGLLGRALEKAPADRPATGAAFAQALHALAAPRPRLGRARLRRAVFGMAAGAVVVLVAAGLWRRASTGLGAAAGDAPPRLVVLPLENLGSRDDDGFADGLTEEIINRLAQISGLHVISRSTAMQYKNHQKPLREIGREVGVEYVLEGTIRTDRTAGATGEVRVTQQLIRAADDVHLWSQGYTLALVPGQFFRAQADIAEQVARALGVTILRRERQTLAAQLSEDQQAYEAYLRALAHFGRLYHDADLRRAVDLLEYATARDPDFAAAYALLARVRSRLAFGAAPGERARAREAVDRAVALAPDAAETHLALGAYHMWADRDYERAARAFRHVLEQQPGNADALHQLGSAERRAGEWVQALSHLEQAAQFNPRDPVTVQTLARTYYFLRDYQQAERLFDRLISLAPDDYIYHQQRIQVLLATGELERARHLQREASARFGAVPSGDPSSFLLRILAEDLLDPYRRATVETYPTGELWYYWAKALVLGHAKQPELARAYWDTTRALFEGALVNQELHWWHSRLGFTYAMLGLTEKAIAQGRKALDLVPLTSDAFEGPELLRQHAELHATVGQPDSAITHLDRVLAMPSPYSPALLQLDPVWDPIREHPRFKALLLKYGTPQAR